MVDVKENSLEVGDKVVYIRGSVKSPELSVGTVTKIYGKPDCFGHDECSVDNYAHIKERRIIKISSLIGELNENYRQE